MSISNIGWDAINDSKIYGLMQKNYFQGLEIAPTRIIENDPYSKCKEASVWAKKLKKRYGFVVSSMQSIWFGRQEHIFGTETERKELLIYTKKSIDFAVVIGCKNLVFGCPKNRVIPNACSDDIAIDFFREIGEYAANKGTIIAMEANPPIYNTNYINDTEAAFNLIEKVDSKGFLLNLDVGTMIYNGEEVDELVGKVPLINHIHISEPGLKAIEKRQLHLDLKDVLMAEKYDGFISIEMAKVKDISVLDKTMTYVRQVFE